MCRKNVLFYSYMLALLAGLLFSLAPVANADVLNVYLLAGQSNMEGQAYTYNSAATAGWNVPTMEFLLSGSPAATTYRANMPYGFEDSLDASWLDPRDDVWAVHYNSGSGTVKDVLPTNDPVDIVSGIQPLMPGFGVNTNFGSMFGAELGMGIRLGDALDSPVFLFKSDRGGTTLCINWRPPSAVAARGGVVGADYVNTMTSFIDFLDDLDADLADDNLLNDYNNATGYVVAGVFWLQGWNEKYVSEQLKAEYADNHKDLIYSIRAADVRIPNDLPLIIGESADQDAGLNTSRQAAVDQLNIEIPGSADFFDTDNMKGENWGNNDLGVPFSTNWGSHYHARAESYLEIGWKAAGSVLDNGFYLNDQTSLQFSAVGVTDANSVDTVSLYGAITDDADQVMVYWGSVDQGATTSGWSDSKDMGAWNGGLGQIPVTLTGLQPDTSYMFRYWADSVALADDAWSRAGEVKTDFSAEQVPSDMAANPISFAQIDLTWSEDFNTESGFLLRRSDDPNGTVNVVDVDLPANATFYSDLTVTAVSTYYYQVAARNAYGLSDFSESVSITTPDVPEVQAAVITAYYDFEPNSLPEPNSPLSPLYDRAGTFADNLTGYNATWSADVPATTGSKQSASFDGDTALFTDAYSSDLGPDPDAYTIMFWIKARDADQENSGTRLMTTRTRPDGSDAAKPAWQIEGFGKNGTKGGKMDLRANNGSKNLFTADAKSGSIGALANTGQETVWHHVVFVVANSGHPDDAGAYAETFFDGVSVGVVNLDPSWDGFNIANPDGQLIIGSTGETGGSRDFTGLLDDLALFSGIVTAEDIAAIAAGTLSPGSFLGIYEADPSSIE